MRDLRLYFDLLWLDFTARSQYRADFLIGIGAQVLQHVVTLLMLWVIFGKVSALGGWNAAQVTFLYGTFTICQGLLNLISSGLGALPSLIEQGNLDRVLILPANPYLQLLPRFNPAAFGALLLGGVILAVTSGPAGVAWSPGTALFFAVAVLCGTAILLGFMTALYSLSFWVHQPGIAYGLLELTELARYPAGIYPRWVQVLITWIFPVSFAGFYPASVLTQSLSLWQGLLAVPAALLATGIGGLAWRAGLRKYEGAGS